MKKNNLYIDGKLLTEAQMAVVRQSLIECYDFCSELLRSEFNSTYFGYRWHANALLNYIDASDLMRNQVIPPILGNFGIEKPMSIDGGHLIAPAVVMTLRVALGNSSVGGKLNNEILDSLLLLINSK